MAAQFPLERVDDLAAALLGQLPGFTKHLAGRPDGQLEFDRLVRIQGAVNEVVGKSSRHGAIGAWALVHGLSVLAAERQLSADLLVPEALTALVANITEAYVSGLKTISSKDAEQAN